MVLQGLARAVAQNRRARANLTRQLRREVRALVNPYEIAEAIFVQNYRLSKNLTRFLVRQLEPLMRPVDVALGIPNSIKILCALNFYASGSYQAQIGNNWMNCLGRSTVGFCITEVTDALNNRAMQRRWIKFPHSRRERQQLRERHQRVFNIPGVLGFIDGTEVSIFTPPRTMNPQSYWTRKHHYALNCQIICDCDLMILNINASYAGASRDAFIYKFSPARRKMRAAFEEDQSTWLLGDSGYPCEPWLMVPIKNAEEGSPEAYYTELHCKARNCVERCIGILKGRFRCLLKDRVLHYKPLKAGKIIKACCVLHNMCRKAAMPDCLINIPEGEEDGVPWAAQQYEAELEELEDEDPDDPELMIPEAADNLLQVGRVVQGRLVTFLGMQRQGLLN